MPVQLRADFDAAGLRLVARRAKDAGQARRLLALASIYDGSSRTEADRIGGVTLYIIRDRVLKLNAHGPVGLIDGKAQGQPPRLNAAPSGSFGAVIGVWVEFRIRIAKQTMSRELRALGYRKLSARPRHHAQAEGAIERFNSAMLLPPTPFNTADAPCCATSPSSASARRHRWRRHLAEDLARRPASRPG